VKTKKAVGGLEFLRAFMIGLAIVVILAFALSLMSSSLSNSLLTQGSYTSNNIYLNITGYTLTQSTLSGFTNPAVTGIVNASNGAVIPVGNATIISKIVYNATSPAFPYLVNLTYSYTGTSDSVSYGIIGNFTNGLASLGSNVSTWITLASLVVIVGIIAVVIYLVSRFGGSSEMN
jgi:hypothetical protein